jgi:flagellar hook assembly protein FlgD
VSSGQPIHSTLVMEITIEGKTEKITENITSTGEGSQSVTVPAGTYTASVVNVAESADVEGYNLTIDDKTWLASGVGPVQSELISVDGSTTSITNKQELTSFIKG